MKNKDMSIIIIGFDGYKDLWNDFFELFNRFWRDCPFEVIFVNNLFEIEPKGITVLHAGEHAEWSKKVRLALEQVDSPYVLLLLEDFFIGKKIDTKEVLNTIDYIKTKNLNYYKLTNMNRAIKKGKQPIDNKDYLFQISEDDEYGVSLQAAIWKKTFLADLIGIGNYNAWKFEFDRVHAMNSTEKEARDGCVYDSRNILNIKHGVMQGKYLPNTLNYFKKIGIKLNTSRPIMTYSQYYRVMLQSLVKYSLPIPAQRRLKKLMENFGYEFVSTKRDK